jgi:hypothetical protein
MIGTMLVGVAVMIAVLLAATVEWLRPILIVGDDILAVMLMAVEGPVITVEITVATAILLAGFSGTVEGSTIGTPAAGTMSA